jgi:hypothetical protein
MSTYKKIKIDDTVTLFHDHIGAIPDDPENRHYAAYLEWVAEGNTAEEVTPQL